MQKKERFKNVFEWFEKHVSIVSTELHYKNPYQLLVAVILSAQCTDKRVNTITPAFFERFPTVEDLAKAEVNDIYQLISSCSYPNNKSKNLSGMAKMLVTFFNSVVPSDVELMQNLPGVGRKTANVVASVIYNKPTLAVDTHVFRVSARIGLSENAKTPLETELQLIKNIPKKQLPNAHHWLILHGRYTCVARKPKCNICGLTEWCKYYQNFKNEI